MAVTLHVSNLVWEASADDLFLLFQAHGQVLHAQVIMDHDKGWSRGFGFADMADEAAAQRAIDALHGQPFRGRILAVSQANPTPAGSSGR